MISVTTNVAALVAKRNLSENSLQATRSIAKVSQGTRIVKPMDDAASLAIANTMRTSLAGMTQGIRNTTQGSSLLQVAAGGLEQTSQMLTRMKQLAVQVINDTLGSAEVSYANEEFGQLMQQIDSTAEQTRFSGKSLLTGGSADTIYQNTGRSSSFPEVANALAFTGEINEATSSGFVHHKFPGQMTDMKIETVDNDIRVNFGGEYFRGSTGVEANGQFVLISESDEKNVVSIGLSGDISTIETNSNFVLELKKLLLNAEISIGETKQVALSGEVLDADNTFNPDFLDTARTQGIVSGSIRSPADITVNGTNGGGYKVKITIDNELFTQTQAYPSAGGVLELVSETNPGSKIGIRYNEDNIDGITNQETFVAALRGMFINREPEDNTAFNNPPPLTPTGDFISPDFTNVASQAAFQGTFSGEISNIITEAENAQLSAQVTVGNEVFVTPESTEGLNITNGDVITFVSLTDSNNRFSITYGGLADIVGQVDYQEQLAALFHDVTLDISGSTFDIGDSEGAFNDYSLSVDMLGENGNGFAGFNTLYSKGYIDGLATSVEVTGQETGPFDITLVVGNQTFIQRGFDPDFAGNLTLVSQSDPGNVISYTIGEGEGRTYLDTLAELKTSVESLFGLNELNPSAPVRFRSASSANNSYNGINMGNNKTILAGIATKPGTYAVDYNASTHIIKLTNGATVYEEEIEAKDIIEGQTTVSFGNGITLKLGDDINKFDIDSHISQMIFEVSQNDIVQLEFQVSDISRDDMKIKMTAATVDALRLTGSTINGKDLAREAQDKIDLAITSINTGLANIGAQQSRFEFVRVNLTIQMENTSAARATYYDVDMGGEITDFTKYQTLTQAATSMLTQANKMPQELMRLLP